MNSKTLRITSIKDLLKYISSRPSRLYRGQADCEWLLLPQISRIKSNIIMEHFFHSWSELENDIIHSFKMHGLQYLNREPKNDLEWLIHAQHHGAPTRLLDWSSSPLKALYFSVEDIHRDDKDGSFFDYLPFSTVLANDVDIGSSVLQLFHPIEINSRITAQSGCFSLFPLPEGNNDFIEILELNHHQRTIGELDDHGVVHKFLVPKEFKSTIRIELNQLGINDKSMFPDLDGVAKYIKRKFETL